MGSSPTTPTMITFRYKDKQYTTNNLKNKLDKLGISIDEIEIMGNRDTEELDNSIQKYYFKNTITGETIVSIYPNLEHLRDIINIYEYKEICDRRI